MRIGEKATPAIQASECVLVMTHKMDPGVRTLLRDLSEADSAERSLVLAFDVAGGAEPPSAAEWPHAVFRFDSRHFNQWGFSTFGDSMMPGHVHFPVLRFFESHPEYDRIWVVEYDVRFNGSWAEFFEAFEEDQSDLLACHFRAWAEEPDWWWWSSVSHPTREPGRRKRVRGFFVIYRISRPAAVTLSRLHREGWRGHFEALVPTLLLDAGHSIADIGGAGSFTPPGRRGRFYSSYSDSGGGLRDIGSVRFRPPMVRAGRRAGFLYHPVKYIRGAETPPAYTPGRLFRVLRTYARHLLWRVRRAQSR